MQEAEKEKKEKSSGQEDSAKVIEKAEITTLALENEKDEQQKQNEGQEDPVTGLAARLSSSSATYNALQQEPEVIVTKNGQQLESKDYTYTWSSEDGHDKLWFHAGKYNCHVFVDGKEIASLEYNISPAPLTVVTDSAKKKYDGTPLTAPGHVEGLLMNHDSDDTGAVTVTTTSSQTEVGTSANMEYTVAYKSSFIENDYQVVNEEFGTLTVYCEHEDWAENDGHWVYEDVATATCTKPGAYTKSCPVCKTIISKTETPAHGHSLEKVEWIFADDAQHKKVCEWCSGEEKGGVEYAAHDFTEWKVVTEATIDSEGLESRSCVDCGYVQERPIPMLPSCHVYWFDGYTSQVLQEGKVLKGDTADDTEDNAKALANPANPSRAGYEFLGWGLPVYDKDSVTITATWRLLTARWIDEDGTELAKADFKLSDDGLTASEPEYVGTVPTKAEDDDNTYEFAGWVVDSTTNAGDITYKATYTAIPKYTVTWVNWNGDELYTTTVVGEENIPAADTP